MMTIDQILTKLDHYYKEDQLDRGRAVSLILSGGCQKRAGVWHLYFRRQRASGLLQKHRTV